MKLDEIKKYLPHREPFLFVDEIIELEKGKKILGQYKVKEDSFWINAHFENFPIMPGVLILEALAQVSLLIFKDLIEGKIPIFVKIENFTFKKPVFPGDILFLESFVVSEKMGFVKFDVKCTKDKEIVCEGKIIATLKRKEEIKK
ncbi:MAG: 3-hydroxyacyl-ACP dehydratase FabZ [Caldisericia bacterium]|nr:3-hydroxyacyl-ACP dehydratase FabZ [Caldisericia bacterium]